MSFHTLRRKINVVAHRRLGKTVCSFHTLRRKINRARDLYLLASQQVSIP